MDAKDLRTVSGVSERNNDNTKHAPGGGSTLHCDRNKPYQNIGSNTLVKMDGSTARPCAIIGPDRIVPPTAVSDAYLRKAPTEQWLSMDNVYRRPPDYQNKLHDFQNPTRNISPRQTFQENMQRIMVPPTYNSIKTNIDHTNTQMPDRNDAHPKNIKLNVPPEGKFCDVPYIKPTSNEQKSRNPDMCLPSVSNPTRTATHGWPNSVNVHPSKTYGAPELYQYPEYPSCAGPRPVLPRPHRSAPEEAAYIYPDAYYQDGNIRYKPYPNVKERYPQQRYEYIGNYPSPFHPPPSFSSHKYEVQKPMHPHPYPTYPAMKYLDGRITEPPNEGYQRNPQGNYNLAYRNQIIHPNYGPVVGNCIQSKMHSYPHDAHIKNFVPNKLPYDNNPKAYIEYDSSHQKLYPTTDNYFVNDINRMQPMKSQVIMPNYSTLNVHNIPPPQYYKKDVQQIKNIEYMTHYRNIDPNFNIHNHISRHPSMFSPNTLAISPTDSNTSNDNIQSVTTYQEDCGYVSQSSTASVRSIDSSINRLPNEYFRKYHENRYGPVLRTPHMMQTKTEIHTNNSSKDKKNSSNEKNLNVRQFLQMWNEEEDEAEEKNSKEIVIPTGSGGNVTYGNTHDVMNNEEQLYVLGLVNVPSHELAKYEHIQKVSKLPENIKGYNNIELLTQFEEAIESSKINNYKSPAIKEFQKPLKTMPSNLIADVLPPRPVSPLDVEAKISQSVIHKEVGCNFEIRPCSPKMLNVEIAAPIQNILTERSIEKVVNPILTKTSILNSIVDNVDSNILNISENGRNPSCKLNTQFSNNNTIDPIKNNYSLQDLESNSGLCLASLPRLDNDIEFNFTEVNQQFINANKNDSCILTTPLNDLPTLEVPDLHENHIKDKLLDVNSPRIDIDINQAKSPHIQDTEKEVSKLSKYRKIKASASDIKETIVQTNVNTVRTDSVIIKNPENTKKFEDNLNITNSINKTTGNLQDIPINLTSQGTEKNTLSILPLDANLDSENGSENNKDKMVSDETAIDFSLNKNSKPHTVNITMNECYSETKDNRCGDHYIDKHKHEDEHTTFSEPSENIPDDKNMDINVVHSPTIEEVNIPECAIPANGKISADSFVDNIYSGVTNNNYPASEEHIVCATLLEECNDIKEPDNNNETNVNVDPTLQADSAHMPTNVNNNVFTEDKNHTNNVFRNYDNECLMETYTDENNLQNTPTIKKNNCEELAQTESSEESKTICREDKPQTNDAENICDDKNELKRINNNKEIENNNNQDEKTNHSTIVVAPENKIRDISDNDIQFTQSQKVLDSSANIFSSVFNSDVNETNHVTRVLEALNHETKLLNAKSNNHDEIQTDNRYLWYGSKEMYSPWIQKLIIHTEGNIRNRVKNYDESNIDASKANLKIEKNLQNKDEVLNGKSFNLGIDMKIEKNLQHEELNTEEQRAKLVCEESTSELHDNPHSAETSECNSSTTHYDISEPDSNMENTREPFSFNANKKVEVGYLTTLIPNTHKHYHITPFCIKETESIYEEDIPEINCNENIDKTENQNCLQNLVPLNENLDTEILSSNKGSCNSHLSNDNTSEFNSIILTNSISEVKSKEFLPHSRSNSGIDEPSNKVFCQDNTDLCVSLNIDKNTDLNTKTCTEALQNEEIIKDKGNISSFCKNDASESCVEVSEKTLNSNVKLNKNIKSENDITNNEQDTTECDTDLYKTGSAGIRRHNLYEKSHDINYNNLGSEHKDYEFGLEANKESRLVITETINLESNKATLLHDEYESKIPGDVLQKKSDEQIEETEAAPNLLISKDKLNEIFNSGRNNISNYEIKSKEKKELKRSLSDSALNIFTNKDQNRFEESDERAWRFKRRKLNDESEILAQNICKIIQNNRRNSVSSFYAEDNVSFCILIDNSCIISEEDNGDQYTKLSDHCLAGIESENCVKNEENMESVLTEFSSPPRNVCEYSAFSLEYEEEKTMEESWVEDVACVETVVSDDIAEDIEINQFASPVNDNMSDNDEPDVFSSSDHTDKVKFIYGGKMCNDDAQFVETLFNTPQMNVNRTLHTREPSHTSESFTSEISENYYDKDSLEKMLSESSPNTSPKVPKYIDSINTSVNSNNTPEDKENIKSEIRCSFQNENNRYDPLDIDMDQVEDAWIPHASFDKTQDDTIHSCESSLDNVFTYKQKEDSIHYTTSSSPEVSSTTSEEKNSSLLLKITSFKGSTISQINDINRDNKNPSCKFTEDKDYLQSHSSNSKKRPLITKGAQKYIPPLKETIRDLKVKLSLPQHSLIKLKQLKLSKDEPKINKQSIPMNRIPKKPKPKFEDVLKSIDEIQFKMHKEKSKKTKKTIPKVVIKKARNGSHYAHTSDNNEFNPDLTGRKWQPWVFIEKNNFIDKMALKRKTQAIYSHRKKAYVLAEKFKKYKSVSNSNFVISPPISSHPSTGLKYTIRLKHY